MKIYNHFRWLLFFGSFFFIVQLVFAQSYLWPTSASQLISSSFCEYRSGHFHAGLDFKTWGREGYPVYAISDGYITRVRVSPYGYGKAVYLKLNNGQTVVYGHLQKFSAPIEKWVTQKQDASGRYAVNFWLSRKDVPVTAGMIIGYSGSTGIGVPHLHFEVRDNRNRPINPFLLGYQIKDSITPIPVAVAATPFSVNSHVQGDVLPQILPIRYTGGKSYALVDTLFAWGQVGLSVDSYDQANGAYNKFAAYRAQLILDGKPVFTSQYDGFDYSETDQIYLDRDYWLMQKGKGRFQNLYIPDGNQLDFYWPKFKDAGLLKVESHPTNIDDPCVLSEGVYGFQIILADFFGNASTIHGVLKWTPNHPFQKTPTVNSAIDTPHVNVQILNDQVRIGVDFPQFQTKPHRIRILVDQMVFKELPLRQIQQNEWMASFPADHVLPGPHVLDIQVLDSNGQVLIFQKESYTMCHPSMRQVVTSESGQCQVTVHRGGIRNPIWCQITESRGVSGFPDAIVYQFKPDDVLFTHAVDVSLVQQNPITDKHGLYRIDTKGRLKWMNHEIKGNQIDGKMRHISPVTVVADTVPPQINSIFPQDGMVLTTRRPYFQVTFEDTLSGIYGEDNYQLVLDGKRMIVAYDPEKKMGEGILRHALLPGQHVLEVIIRDRVKNETKKSLTFHIQ